ncbi:SEC-C metal-binding domain-containing protein [Endozoicomonas sp. GU-1]|uniref:IS1096 element passenger TnpR family protein n=1 Tax=Endozoicomonas sp. GU-1 TaxID=3009078 RepID=UPI0022B368D1|nr:SEC-C metal-binding domain-containing protein [Endozoicomonas sp. GU-1]WBA82600.1 SEC-C metal-binding domain-containing protein [Endozoicomonas sp. GU-1]WBA85529.1 SEC-C metal-binding domain-containing protein [Endozoicomonas sp. GU-1]
MFKLNRNEPCACGSGKKYKKCCFLEPEKDYEIQRAAKMASSLDELQSIISQPPLRYKVQVELIGHPYFEFEHDVIRTFELSGKETLYDLHLKIQYAFDWDNDHMFSFYTSNEYRDRDNEYSGSPDGEHLVSSFGFSQPTKSASATEIRDLGFAEQQEFLYLFDYGDELVHRITVVGISEADSNERVPFRVISSVGENVGQYCAYEEKSDDG